MLDAQPNRRMDVESVQIAALHEPNLARFGARAELAAKQASGEADRELLADLAVVVGHDVSGVCVDADDARDLHVQAGLLLRLAHSRVRDRLAQIHRSAGYRPEV